MVGVYLAVVQLVFTLTWTVYAFYLPALAKQVGIPAEAVSWVLVADQLIFAVGDLATGAMADRLARGYGRLGLAVLGMTLVSTAAFLLLPQVGSPAPFLALIAVWSVTSSALRAPLLALIAKHAAKPAKAWLASAWLVGMGLAGIAAPSLTMALRDLDPRLPFVLASVGLALATTGIVWAERRLVRTAAAPPPGGPPRLGIFLGAVALVALGFQIHVFLNSAPRYLRFANPSELPRLMPAFWVGFTLFMLPAGWAAKRAGGLAVAAAGCVVGAVAALLGSAAGSLAAEVVTQLVAGAGWAAVLMGAVAAAMSLAGVGREGRASGGLFAVLAVAALARIALVATHATQRPELAPVLGPAPVLAWLGGGLAFVALARQRAA
jgi:MFS family permease